MVGVLFHLRQYLPGHSPDWLLELTAHGYLAVDLFFILSVFVLALSHPESFGGGRAGATRFYRLQVARLYPFRFIMLMLFPLNPLPNTSAYGGDNFAMSLFLVQNCAFSTEVSDSAWSISTEGFALTCVSLRRVIATIIRPCLSWRLY